MTEFTPQALSQLDKDRLGQYGKNLDFYNITREQKKSLKEAISPKSLLT